MFVLKPYTLILRPNSSDGTTAVPNKQILDKQNSTAFFKNLQEKHLIFYGTEQFRIGKSK